MSIKVYNRSADIVSVAINQWGDDGSTDDYRIEKNGDEQWDRTDDRGFVMSLTKGGSSHPYYVTASSSIDVNNDGVTINGKIIKPLSV